MMDWTEAGPIPKRGAIAAIGATRRKSSRKRTDAGMSAEATQKTADITAMTTNVSKDVVWSKVLAPEVSMSERNDFLVRMRFARPMRGIRRRVVNE